jgi:hypothetical protein
MKGRQAGRSFSTSRKRKTRSSRSRWIDRLGKGEIR